MRLPISIVIPVYNAFDESRQCLESVLKHSSCAENIVIIDDASTEGDFSRFIADLSHDERIQLFRNETNLGFVKTCNRGMRLAEGTDVVLLNSDTLVTSRWLEKLSEAAYSSEMTGTVTPFTNNGVICSVPNFCMENSVPGHLSLEEWNSMIENTTAGEYVRLPSCVGFCVYLRRTMLDAVGLFDEESYGLGYGEENDLSLRAQAAGFHDILDHKTFIFHKGNCSFLGLREKLSETHLEILRKRYPHYLDTVSKFCSRNPLRSFHHQITNALMHSWCSDRPRVLHILHNGPEVSRGDPLGGTEHHVMDIIQRDFEHAHWSLVVANYVYYLTLHMPGYSQEYAISMESTSIAEIISSQNFELVHVHHNRWFDHTTLVSALLEHGNYVVSFHDFALLCPRFHLRTLAGDICTGQECTTACGYRNAEIQQLRTASIRLMEGAAKLISFSLSTQKIVEAIAGRKFSWLTIPHGVPAVTENPTEISPSASGFRIAVIGSLTASKGAVLLEKLLRLSTLGNRAVEWHLFGTAYFDLPSTVVDHGKYSRVDLSSLLSSANIQLALFLSMVPETYGMTVDEALNAGIPVVVTPFGAPCERVRDSGAGWVLDSVEYSAVKSTLDRIVADQPQYHAVSEAVRKTTLSTLQAEARIYEELYSQNITDRAQPMQALKKFLDERAFFPSARISIFWKGIGTIVSAGIHILDTVGIRMVIQKALVSILPTSTLNRIKRSR